MSRCNLCFSYRHLSNDSVLFLIYRLTFLTPQLHPTVLAPVPEKAQEFQFVVDSLMKKHCEKLSKQILAHNLTPAMYATQWFLTAFTQRFPYDLVTRVWDMFLLEDWKVFYRVCLALFK